MNFFSDLRVRGNRGGALIMSFIVMVLLCYASASLVQVRSSDLTQSTDHVEKFKSANMAMAAIEFAKYRVNNGVDPVVTAKTFADGQFDIAKDVSGGKIMVAGRVGKAETEQTVDMDFASKCISFEPTYNVSFGATEGGIYNLKFKKTCHDKVAIDKMSIFWPSAMSSQKVKKIITDNNVAVYDGANTPGIGTPAGGAQSGAEIDIQDLVLSDAASHVFTAISITYPQGAQPPQPETFTIKLVFKDGSTSTFNCNW